MGHPICMVFNVYTKVPLTYLTDTKGQVDEDIFEESERKGKDAKHIPRSWCSKQCLDAAAFKKNRIKGPQRL